MGGSTRTADRLARLLSSAPPGVPQKPQIFGHEQPIDEEKIARLTCRSSGSKPAAQLRWRKGNKELAGGCPRRGALPLSAWGAPRGQEGHQGWQPRAALDLLPTKGTGTGRPLLKARVSLVALLGCCVPQLRPHPVPADEGTEVVEDPNGKTFTVSSRVEFRVTKEDNEAEVTCTVDHESLQNSERSTTQKLQVHCAWGRWGSRGRGQGCGGVGGEEEEAASASPSHSWPYAYPQPGASTVVLSHAG